jgi:ATP-dependent exoDNAse (exonuclease V) alpha subunit
MAHTGAAASAFGGRTIVTASGLKSAIIEPKQMEERKRCKILVIDEISFMSESELILLDLRLRRYRNRNKVYGGFSVIFCGDFRQLQIATETEENYFTQETHKENSNQA